MIATELSPSSHLAFDMNSQSPTLPPDVIRECFEQLGWRDLLACKQVCRLYDQLISDSEELQLRIHLAENAIQPSDTPSERTSDSVSEQLSRLRIGELRHRQVRFGKAYGDRDTFQLTATNLANMHMVGLVDDFIFVPLQIPNLPGLRGITRHCSSGAASPPNLIHFQDDVRHFEVDAAEGALSIARRELRRVSRV